MEDNAFYPPIALYDQDWYCEECLREKNALQDASLEELYAAYDAITEVTVEYEQYPGELIPLEGVYCTKCESELYPPLDTEE